MPISMHSASVPVFVQTFNAMLGWLDKAEAHAKARKFDSANYLQLRLAPDMLPFVSQIRIASDHGKGLRGPARRRRDPQVRGQRSELRRAARAHPQDVAFVQSVPADALRRQRGARDRAAETQTGPVEVRTARAT